MDFRTDDVAVGFAPFLAEAEAGDVVDIGARGPALAEIALAHRQQAEAAEFLRRSARVRHALVLHAGDDHIVVRAGLRLAAEIDVMHEAARRVVLRAIGEVVAAVDRPEITGMHHPAAPRAVPHQRQQEAALARLLLERVVEERRVEERHVAHNEHAVVGNRALAGNNVETLAAQTPPRPRRLAVGDEAVMQNVLRADAFRPFAFEMEGIVGGQHPRLGHDVRLGFPDHVVELAGLLVGVIGEVAGPHFHVPLEVVEKDVAAGAYIAGILVEIDLVGAEKQLRVFDLGGRSGRPPQLVNVALEYPGSGSGNSNPHGQGFGWNGGRGLRRGSGIHLTKGRCS